MMERKELSFGYFCRLLMLFGILFLSFNESQGGALPSPIIQNSNLQNSLKPIENTNPFPIQIVKRLPIAVFDTAKASIGAFLQTAGVMIPAGLIWKFGVLRGSGLKPWLRKFI
jgi:hypothetical protein